jgi:hypothetical protein
MNNRLDSATHKMRREAAKFQRGETVKQRRELVNNLNQNPDFKKNKLDVLRFSDEKNKKKLKENIDDTVNNLL